MSEELKAIVVNLKSLDQDIEDPILQGAGDANGRTFRIILSQEAADMLTPETKIYLKWRHQELDVRGYNVFTKVQDADCFHPAIWEIHWPHSMLYEGNVLCRIELVDDVSISPSVNFMVHVLADPDDGSKFVVSDDYSIFQTAVIEMNAATQKALEQLEDQQKEFDSMRQEFGSMREDIQAATDKANEAYDLAKDALDQIEQKETATGVIMTEY